MFLLKDEVCMVAEKSEKVWKKFLRNHWQMLIIFIIVIAVAIIGSLYVFLWFIKEAQLTNLVPTTLGAWSMGYFMTFLLNLIFWEFIYIGIFVIIAILLIYFILWKRIPDAEREEYNRGHLFGKPTSKKNGGEGISFLIFIFFIIKVYIDGNWGKTFGTWEFDYLVYSWLWALVIVLAIFGIPIAIGGTWWLRHELNKNP